MDSFLEGGQADGSAGDFSSPAAPGSSDQSVKVWDPVVRLFHWSLVIAFVTAWTTGEEWKSLHENAGYVIAGLLGVRVIWGLVGTRHARFSDFVYHPSKVAGYLVDTAFRRAKRHVGHNPAGGAMVIALMLLLAATATTGIMMTSDAWWGIRWVQETHEVLANLAVLMVGLHLIGVLVASLEHRENLVRSMITGRKRAP